MVASIFSVRLLALPIRRPLVHVNSDMAVLRWLNRTTPELDEARATFEDIAANAHRANEVVQAVRGMIAKTDHAVTSIDISRLPGNDSFIQSGADKMSNAE